MPPLKPIDLPILTIAHPKVLNADTLALLDVSVEELTDARLSWERDFVQAKLAKLFQDHEKMEVLAKQLSMPVEDLEKSIIDQIQALLDTETPVKDGFIMVSLYNSGGGIELISSKGRQTA